MERVIAELELLISDLVFGGTDEAGMDMVRRTEKVRRLLHELGMKTGEQLCGELEDRLTDADHKDAVATVCRLSCYCECIKGSSHAL